MVAALMLSLSVGTIVKPAKGASEKEFVAFFAKGGIKSAKLEWASVEGAKKVKIYRADVTKKYKKGGSFRVSKKKFKRIATVSGKTTEFKNTKVKKKRCYAYYIDVYTKKNGKIVCTHSSYSSYKDLAYIGIERPTVSESDSDNYHTDENQIFFRVSYGVGAKPKKFILYRKAIGEKKYKKIKLKPQSNSDDYPFLYCDTDVKANKGYIYRAKGYYKQGKKKYYSKRSYGSKIWATYKSNEE